MIHTVQLVELDGQIVDVVVCVCGEVFTTNVDPDWTTAIELVSKHFQEKNI